MRVKQVGKVSKLFTRDFKCNSRREGVSNLSLLRMLSVYCERIPTSLKKVRAG